MDLDAITAEEYARAFRAVADRMPRDLLEAHLAAPDYTATWQDLAEAVGKLSYRGVNARYGTFAREVAELLGVVEKPVGWVMVLVTHAEELGSRGHTAFILRPAVIEALSQLGFAVRPKRPNSR
jgi:hypothetical protein